MSATQLLSDAGTKLSESINADYEFAERDSGLLLRRVAP